MYALFAVLGVAALCVDRRPLVPAGRRALLPRVHLRPPHRPHQLPEPLLPDQPAERPDGRSCRCTAPARSMPGGGPTLRASTVPAWTVWLLRFQLGVVYVFGAVAKLNPDWLLHAQPLRIWLGANVDLPLIGAWLEQPWVALRLQLRRSAVRRRDRAAAALAADAPGCVRGGARLPPAHGAAVPDRHVPLAHDRADADLLRAGLAAPLDGRRRADRRRRAGAAPLTARRRLGVALLGAYAVVQIAVPLAPLPVRAAICTGPRKASASPGRSW